MRSAGELAPALLLAPTVGLPLDVRCFVRCRPSSLMGFLLGGRAPTRGLARFRRQSKRRADVHHIIRDVHRRLLASNTLTQTWTKFVSRGCEHVSAGWAEPEKASARRPILIRTINGWHILPIAPLLTNAGVVRRHDTFGAATANSQFLVGVEERLAPKNTVRYRTDCQDSLLGIPAFELVNRLGSAPNQRPEHRHRVKVEVRHFGTNLRAGQKHLDSRHTLRAETRVLRTIVHETPVNPFHLRKVAHNKRELEFTLVSKLQKLAMEAHGRLTWRSNRTDPALTLSRFPNLVNTARNTTIPNRALVRNTVAVFHNAGFASLCFHRNPPIYGLSASFLEALQPGYSS